MFLRVERETLRRFPETRCILFTIRTYVTPILSSCPTAEASARLAAALEALPGEVRDYKDLASSADAVAEALRRVCG
jgi:hypothetical protein